MYYTIVNRAYIGQEVIYSVLEYVFTEGGECKSKVNLYNEGLLALNILNNRLSLTNAILLEDKIVGKPASLDRFNEYSIVVLIKLMRGGEVIGYKVSTHDGQVKNIKIDDILLYCNRVAGLEYIPVQNMIYTQAADSLREYETHTLPIYDMDRKAFGGARAETPIKSSKFSSLEEKIEKSGKKIVKKLNWCIITINRSGKYQYIIKKNNRLYTSLLYYRIYYRENSNFIICKSKNRRSKLEEKKYFCVVIGVDGSEKTEISIDDFGSDTGEECNFSYCKNLTKITISNTINNVSNAFRYCDNLIEVDLSKSCVTTLLQSEFVGCSKLRIVHFPHTLIHMDELIFSQTRINHINLSNTQIKKLGDYGKTIKYIDLPLTLEIIGNYALGYEMDVLDLSLYNIKTIMSFCMMQSSIKKIILPNYTIEKISKDAFNGARNLIEINTEALKVNGICLEAFNETLVKKLKFNKYLTCIHQSSAGTSQIEIIDLEDTSIEYIGFEGKNEVYGCICACEKLRQIKFPRSLKNLGRLAIVKCNNLKILDLSDTVIESISSQAIKYNHSITEIYLPINFNGNIADEYRHMIKYGKSKIEEYIKDEDMFFNKMSLIYDNFERLGNSQFYFVTSKGKGRVITYFDHGIKSSNEYLNANAIYYNILRCGTEHHMYELVIFDKEFIHTGVYGYYIQAISNRYIKYNRSAGSSMELILYENGCIKNIDLLNREGIGGWGSCNNIEIMSDNVSLKVEYRKSEEDEAKYGYLKCEGGNVYRSEKYSYMATVNVNGTYLLMAVYIMPYFKRKDAKKPIRIKKCMVINEFGREIYITGGYAISAVEGTRYLKIFKYSGTKQVINNIRDNTYIYVDMNNDYELVEDIALISKLNEIECTCLIDVDNVNS